MNADSFGPGAGPERDVHVIVLAAGASTRFGSPKQLVRFSGRPMLHSVLSRAVEIAGSAVTVVLGANAELFAPLLRHSPASIAINRDWERGMSSSIRVGLGQLGGGIGGVMILLADQPAVTTEDLRRLLGAWRRQPDGIAAAHYSGTVGVPAIFPSWCLRELAELRGDRGARALLQRHADRVVRVPMPAAAQDVDTPEDLLLVDAPKPPESA